MHYRDGKAATQANAELWPETHIMASKVLLYNFEQLVALLDFITRTILGALLTQYSAGYKIERNEMGGACGTYGEGRGSFGGEI